MASRARFVIASAEALPFPSGAFQGLVSGLTLNFVPEPVVAVGEAARVVRPGGTVGAYIWDYSGKMEMIRYFWDEATELDPRALDLDEGRCFPLCRQAPLAQLFREAGLARVEVRSIDVPTVFRDFEDYWSPFLGGQGPAPSYLASLTAEHRQLLRERLQARLPTAEGGAIGLIARARAVRGTA